VGAEAPTVNEVELYENDEMATVDSNTSHTQTDIMPSMKAPLSTFTPYSGCGRNDTQRPGPTRTIHHQSKRSAKHTIPSFTTSSNTVSVATPCPNGALA